MQYHEFAPDARLATYIHRYWFLTGSGREPDDAQLHPIVPDGRMELVINLADRFRRHYRDGNVETQASVLLAGQITECVVVQPLGVIDLVGVRFQPAGAAALVDAPPHELRNRIFDPALIAATFARGLPERLHDACDMDARVIFLNQHFSRLADRATRPDPGVTIAVDRILVRRGRVRIGAIAADLGIPARTLERRFRDSVGVSPKLLARITRFQHAFQLVQEPGNDSWTAVAHRCGYFDQAHLIRDFREFAGVSPSSFLQGQTALAAFFASGTGV